MSGGITEIRNVLLFPGVRDGRTLAQVPKAAVFIKDGVAAGKCSGESRDNLLAKWNTRKAELNG